MKKTGKKGLTEPAPGWYTGPIMRFGEKLMKTKERFTVEKNWCDRDNMYFYDVVDHHPLRDRRVVSWYTEKPTFKGDRNYGYACAKEDADVYNLKYGYDGFYHRMNMKKKWYKEAELMEAS